MLGDEQIPNNLPKNLVLKPWKRNTASCLLSAAMKVKQRNPKGVIIVAPSDAWIENQKAFMHNVITCFNAAQKADNILTLGIVPTFPNTGYGYIQYDKDDNTNIKKVNQFREKPDYTTAKEFLKQGNFLWNAGIFIWSTQTVLTAYKTYQPVMYELFEKGKATYNTENEVDFIAKAYPKAENISVDYAILEPSTNIYVLPANFDWNDLGSWGSLHDKTPKDSAQNAVINARVLLKDAENNIIRTEGDKCVVIDGLKNYIVVDRDDVLLIYPKAKEQNIKEIVNEVKNKWGLH